MSNPITQYIAHITKQVNKWMVTHHIINPTILVLVDGGICSQMIAYIRGCYYLENGLKVYYDLHWFKANGMDNDGKYDRPFELLTMYPNLGFKEVSHLRAWWYRHFFKPEKTLVLLPEACDIKRSMYINSYPDFGNEAWFYDAIQKYLSMTDAISTTYIEPDIPNRACAIHVRRGDMSYVVFEGYKSPIEYYRYAIQYTQKKWNPIKYYIFSDEPEWAKKQLEGYIKNAVYITGNKGHEDLLLCARCSIIIASQGTMGRMAGLLNPYSELIIPPTGDWGSFHVERYRQTTILFNKTE